MKKFLSLFLLSTILFNCSKDDLASREQFIGTWNNFPDDLNNEIQFYKDSVVLWNLCEKTVANWSLDQSKIKMKLLNPILNSDNNEWFLKYKLSYSKDSLFLSHEKNDSLIFTLYKVDDYWKHYLKSYNLEIEIPKADMLASLHKKRNFKFPIVYIGWQNKKLTVKGEQFNKVLKTTRDYHYSLKKSNKEVPFDTIHPITVVADKNIPEKSLDSIKNIIRKLNFQNLYFFHVYKHEEIGNTYGKINPDCFNNQYSDWHWYGLYDWDGLDNNYD